MSPAVRTMTRTRGRGSTAAVVVLLCVTVVLPLLYLAPTPADLYPSIGNREMFSEISGVIRTLSPKKYGDAQKLNSIKQDIGGGLKEPTHVVYKDGDSSDDALIVGVPGSVDGSVSGGSRRNGSANNDTGTGELMKHSMSTSSQRTKKSLSNLELIERSEPQRVTYEKIREMEDQIIMAQAYLRFAPANSNSRLVRELKLRIKEIEKVLGHVSKDSDLSRTTLQRMKAMEVTLSKANKVYPDCTAMASKLQAMTYGSEDQLRAQKNQVGYLTQLAARTFSKGLHCLFMQLTTEYFNLRPQERELPNQLKVRNPDLYHYAIFSDNVLACAVVVNSTISTSMEAENIVFHIVTDFLNLPSMMMWFLLNPPGQATIHIESLDDFKWLPSEYTSIFKQPGVKDPRYTSALNHLRFYLPEIYPFLKKVLFLDHDVVVHRDLRGLWSVDMKGNVNGAVERCRAGYSSHRLETLVDFSDSMIAKFFDPKACIWAYGMNIFDLLEWRRRDLTSVYFKWLQLGRRRQLLKAGSLPLGQLTFYNHTIALDRQWHLLGLGYDPNVRRGEVERAAVIHYDGNMKPWLEIGITKYRGYWSKFLDYNNPYFQQCNIHE